MRLRDLIAAELRRANNNARTLYRLEQGLEEAGEDELDREQVLHVRTELLRVWLSEMTYRELDTIRFIVEEEAEERPEWEERPRYRRRRRIARANPAPCAEPLGPTLMDEGSGRDLSEHRSAGGPRELRHHHHETRLAHRHTLPPVLHGLLPGGIHLPERETKRKSAEELLFQLTGARTAIVFPDEIAAGQIANPFGGGREVVSGPDGAPDRETL